MIDILIDWDKALMLWLNGIHHPIADQFMLLISNKYTWFPFYGAMMIWLIYRYKKEGAWMVLLLLLLVLLCDQTTAIYMKPYFQRLRPCHDPSINEWIHLVGNCGGKYGFASAHAANHIGLSVLLFLMFRKLYPKIVWIFLWGLLIAYSRVYLGVHYPGDIIVGGLVGYLYAMLLYTLWKKYIPKPSVFTN